MAESKLFTKQEAVKELVKFQELLEQGNQLVSKANTGILRMQGYIACLNDIEGEKNGSSETSDGSGSGGAETPSE